MLGLRGNTFVAPPDADPYDQMAVAQRLAQATQLGGIAESRSVLQGLLDQESSPEVSLDRQRRPGLAGGLGAMLLGIENPAYATQYAQGVRQVERANAEIAAREALANQVQQGYQKRREQQITQDLAALGLQETKVRAQGQAALAELDAEKKLAGLEQLRAAQDKGALTAVEFDDRYGDKFYADLLQIANADPEMDTSFMEDRLADIVAMAPPSLQPRWAKRLEDARAARAEVQSELDQARAEAEKDRTPPPDDPLTPGEAIFGAREFWDIDGNNSGVFSTEDVGSAIDDVFGFGAVAPDTDFFNPQVQIERANAWFDYYRDMFREKVLKENVSETK